MSRRGELVIRWISRDGANAVLRSTGRTPARVRWVARRSLRDVSPATGAARRDAA